MLMSGGGFSRTEDSGVRGPAWNRPSERRIKCLEIWAGKLVVSFSDESLHPVTPRVRSEGAGAERVDLGCVYVTREALAAVNKAVAEHDEFQRKNSQQLMAQLKRKKKPAPGKGRGK